MQIENFGANVHFQPAHFYTPSSEAEVLELLAKHQGENFRTIGRLHSWSEAAAGSDVVLDLRELNAVRVEQRDGEWWGILQAGCQIKHALAQLRAHGLTLPSLGLITEQTIAGATATATHGSGRHSLSHYVDEVRLARYDVESGEPVIEVLNEGPALEAARCSLGCLGVVLSVGIRCRATYRMEQHFRLLRSLDAVLDLEPDYPLQQFYLLPHRWDYLVQCRRETEHSSSLMTTVHRLYWFLVVDFGLHFLLVLMVRWLRSPRCVRWFYRWAVPLTLIRGWRVVDQSERLLTMEHELFRHIEIEVFVRRSALDSALSYVEQLLQFLDGNRDAIDNEVWDQLRAADLEAAVRSCPPYTHHYPICVRKVLADAASLSMASSPGEAYYAISFICYNRPEERASFFEFATLLAHSTSRLFNARPHWGKVCPIDHQTAERLYPRLSEFREVCQARDPQGVFRNAWMQATLFDGA